MKEKTRDTLANILVIGFVLLLVGFMFWGMIDSIYQASKDEKYCENLFPSSLKKEPKPMIMEGVNWGERSSVEEGYIRCCRKYSENHEIKEECKIFPDGGEK